MPVTVALIGAFGAALPVSGAAQCVGFRAHQCVDERRQQLAQHIGVGGGESFGQHRGQSISWAVVIACIPLLE